MKVELLEPGHLRALDSTEIEGMTGLTLLDDGQPLMSWGVAPLPWGMELWVAVRRGAPLWKRVAMGRLLRWYMGVLLGLGETLYVHAPPRYEHERLFRWLGLVPVGTVAGAVRWEASCPQQ